MQRKNCPITFCLCCGGLGLFFLCGLYIVFKQLKLEVSLENLRTKTGIEHIKVDLSTKNPKDFKDSIDLAKLEQETILAKNSLMTTLLTSLGGGFFVVTTYFSWQNLEVSRKSLKVNEDQQVAERFKKAIELLTHKKTHIQLGGIYALGSILDQENDYYHKQVIQTLTAYLRENAPYPKRQAPENLSFSEQTNPTTIELPRANVQAVMDILSNSQWKNAEKMKKIFLDLSCTDLQGIQIGSGCDLSEAKFVGSNLQGADLGYVNLKWADFSEAILSNVNFRGANLVGADFTNAKLKDARFNNADYRDAEFKDVAHNENPRNSKSWLDIPFNFFLYFLLLSSRS